jgi:hypothetical protein
MGWLEDQIIINLLNQVITKQNQDLVDENALSASVSALETKVAQLQASQSTCCIQLNSKLDKLIAAEIPPPAVTFTATISLDK